MERVARYTIIPERSRVWIDARSSVHPIHSTTDGLEGFVDLHADDAVVGPKKNLTDIPVGTTPIGVAVTP
jgi:hypothetical protein